MSQNVTIKQVLSSESDTPLEVRFPIRMTHFHQLLNAHSVLAAIHKPNLFSSLTNHAGQTSLLHPGLLQVNFLSLLTPAETDGHLGIYSPSETPSLLDSPAADRKLSRSTNTTPFSPLGTLPPFKSTSNAVYPAPPHRPPSDSNVTHLRIRRV